MVDAIRSGDRHAFAEFVGRQRKWVRAVIFGILGTRDPVDDVAQQVWMVVWQRIRELRDVSRWRPWLYRIVRNAAIDAVRDARRARDRRGRLLADAQDQSLRSGLGHDDPASIERHEAVLDAIRALPVLYREPFVLRHINGWDYKQIAEVMSMPVDTVETRLVRARRLLRDALKGCLNTAG